MRLWDLRWFEWQRRALRGGAACALALPLMGCLTAAPVQPWEKGTLAKPEMTFDSDPLDKGFKEHIYSSKESASGGSGVGGGGCGCN
jgi:hypothetical protein